VRHQHVAAIVELDSRPHQRDRIGGTQQQAPHHVGAVNPVISTML
jgi:hypothetical protein